MITRIVVTLMLVSAPAAAQTRPSSTTMTCRQSAQLVQARAALVSGTGGPTCERSFCEFTEIAKRALRPTRDNPNCLIVYTCSEPGPGDWLGADL